MRSMVEGYLAKASAVPRPNHGALARYPSTTFHVVPLPI
jgi:hypothetical protein